MVKKKLPEVKVSVATPIDAVNSIAGAIKSVIDAIILVWKGEEKRKLRKAVNITDKMIKVYRNDRYK